ncbi:DNA-directed RNA polymerase subunit omega [candidate division KSB1 bacterium]
MMSVHTIDLREIEARTDNLYEAVIIISKRAKQINTEINEQIKAHLGSIEIDEESGEECIDRESIISEFDRKAKPTTIAIEEILSDKLKYKYVDNV